MPLATHIFSRQNLPALCKTNTLPKTGLSNHIKNTCYKQYTECTYNVTLCSVRETTVVLETTMHSLWVVLELHVTVNYIKMLIFVQQCFYGKSKPPTIMQIIRNNFWRKLYSNLFAFYHKFA